ncbi:MAG: cob(I)yrinic acid a,c-diamide adenosyltransferase [Prolixibacteraceae bacterium]|jgi:cob(I)alamin adenosyltransferase|nr:cob(I)yrinic acid a,c-diamide adenosyltransferase [Prolixibacteraceae bacterium]
MRVYTKTGDDGTSGLIGGTRVEKYDLRLEAYGTVDELNSWIGLICFQKIDQASRDLLISVQNNLFVIGARLATDLSKTDLSAKLPFKVEEIAKLENEMDRILDLLPPMEHFVLPGGSNLISYCHLARTVCRRAERRVCQLSKEVSIPAELIKYLNRLSDYLFVLSRKFTVDEGIDEVQWAP